MTARGSVENKTRIDMALSRLAENMNPMVVEIIEEAAGRNLWVTGQPGRHLERKDQIGRGHPKEPGSRAVPAYSAE